VDDADEARRHFDVGIPVQRVVVVGQAQGRQAAVIEDIVADGGIAGRAAAPAVHAELDDLLAVAVTVHVPDEVVDDPRVVGSVALDGVSAGLGRIKGIVPVGRVARHGEVRRGVKTGVPENVVVHQVFTQAVALQIHHAVKGYGVQEHIARVAVGVVLAVHPNARDAVIVGKDIAADERVVAVVELDCPGFPGLFHVGPAGIFKVAVFHEHARGGKTGQAAHPALGEAAPAHHRVAQGHLRRADLTPALVSHVQSHGVDFPDDAVLHNPVVTPARGDSPHLRHRAAVAGVLEGQALQADVGQTGLPGGETLFPAAHFYEMSLGGPAVWQAEVDAHAVLLHPVGAGFCEAAESSHLLQPYTIHKDKAAAHQVIVHVHLVVVEPAALVDDIDGGEGVIAPEYIRVNLVLIHGDIHSAEAREGVLLTEAELRHYLGGGEYDFTVARRLVGDYTFGAFTARFRVDALAISARVDQDAGARRGGHGCGLNGAIGGIGAAVCRVIPAAVAIHMQNSVEYGFGFPEFEFFSIGE